MIILTLIITFPADTFRPTVYPRTHKYNKIGIICQYCDNNYNITHLPGSVLGRQHNEALQLC